MSWQNVITSAIFVVACVIASVADKEALSMLLAGAAAGLLIPHSRGKKEEQ